MQFRPKLTAGFAPGRGLEHEENPKWTAGTSAKSVAEAKPEFGEAHVGGFAIQIGQGVFPVGTQSFGDVSPSRSTTIMESKNISWSSPKQFILRLVNLQIY
jgi:hypothetical protein